MVLYALLLRCQVRRRTGWICPIGKAKWPLIALWNIVSRLFVRLIFSGSNLSSLSYQTHIPFLLFYNHCDKSEQHVFGPFRFYLRVSWCGFPIRMMNIQEVDEQELCRQIFFNMLMAWVKIASYTCKSTVGCGSNLVDVFVPCEVFPNMNS